ncbi:MAG: DMT family transporter [Mariniblastus sp.]
MDLQPHMHSTDPTTLESAPTAKPFRYNPLVAGGIVLLGAVLFSAKAIMVKLALPYGIDSVSLLLLRMIFSLPIYVAIVFWIKRIETQQFKTNGLAAVKIGAYLPKLIGLGVVGYYLASYFDFVGLTYIPASLERVILYLYPTIVLLISAIYLKKRISIHQWIAIALCYLGVWIAIRYGTNANASVGTTQDGNHWLGVVLIFLSATTYAIYLVGSGELIPKIGVWIFTCYAMIVSTICISIHFLLTLEIGTLFSYPPQVYFLGLAMAVFATVIPSLLISEGIKRIGASNAAIIGGVGPVSTIILASIFLGESFTVAQLIGTLVVIGGVVYISVNLKKDG